MSHRHRLILLGVVLATLGLVEGGWLYLAVWLGFCFLTLGIAHVRGSPRVFGKRADGTIPAWSWLLFFPLLLGGTVVWHLIRLLSREPARNLVTKDLVVGRRLLASEFDGGFDNIVDLTAEFSEPGSIRRSRGYVNFPILDASAPPPESLRSAVAGLQPGRTFVHCAQGHGRTGLFALALLLHSGAARSVEDGLRLLTTARPGIRLNREQLKCVQIYANDQA